jgi:formylglycine-generating enzyme required for sulfatase activity
MRYAALLAILVMTAGCGPTTQALPVQADATKTITVEEAQKLAITALGMPNSDLQLNELTSISPGVAEALAKSEGNLSLNGLATLTDEAAEKLAQHKGHLALNGVSALSTQALQSLAKRQAGRSATGLPLVGIELNGLKDLPSEGAKALSTYPYSVSLNGLQQLSDDAAASLAKISGLLRLDGLTTLSDKAARALAGHRGGLSLRGLTSLSDNAAASLGDHADALYLMGLTSLTDAQAKSLARHTSGDVYLTALKEVTSLGLAALVKNQRVLVPEGLTNNLGGGSSVDSARKTLLTGQPIENSIGMKFVGIPAGNCVMGDATEGLADPEKQHPVTLTKPFYIGVYEVTNAEWEQLMGTNPSYFKDGDRPVVKVSSEDAFEFCRKLSDLPAEQRAGRVYRLPTEAEWEYACRAGSTTTYSFGNDSSELMEYGWYRANGGDMTHPVGEKKPNAWGLYDMHGNVAEWCSDWWGSYEEGVAVTDPQGPPNPNRELRVIRGGDARQDPENCGSAHRKGVYATLRHGAIGFRLAMNVSIDEAKKKSD